jgi:hypothetical protein
MEPASQYAWPAAGCATRLTTQTEAPDTIGSGGPYRQFVSEQFRLLPVSTAVAALSDTNLFRQQVELVIVVP